MEKEKIDAILKRIKRQILEKQHEVIDGALRDEWRKNLSESHKGITQKPETIKKIKESLRLTLKLKKENKQKSEKITTLTNN
jgi:hypothetical protein